MTFVPSSWGFTCVHKISPVDVSPTLNFPKHMVHKCRSPAQPDSEGTASLSTGGIEGRKTSERRSMRDSSVQGKDHSALSSIPLCPSSLLSQVSSSFVHAERQEQMDFTWRACPHSGSTLSFSRQHSTTQQHPPSPCHHLPSCPSPPLAVA